MSDKELMVEAGMGDMYGSQHTCFATPDTEEVKLARTVGDVTRWARGKAKTIRAMAPENVHVMLLVAMLEQVAQFSLE